MHLPDLTKVYNWTGLKKAPRIPECTAQYSSTNALVTAMHESHQLATELMYSRVNDQNYTNESEREEWQCVPVPPTASSLYLQSASNRLTQSQSFECPSKESRKQEKPCRQLTNYNLTKRSQETILLGDFDRAQWSREHPPCRWHQHGSPDACVSLHTLDLQLSPTPA